MRHIQLAVILLFFCGTAFSQIYTPVSPTIYGENANRTYSFKATGLTDKADTTLDTNNGRPQIFYYEGDSTVWAWSAQRGFFQVGGTGGGSGGNDSIYVGGLIDTITFPAHPTKRGITVPVTILDSLLHKFIDTGARIRNGYVLSYDSTNKKWVMVANSGGGGGSTLQAATDASITAGDNPIINAHGNTFFIDSAQFSSNSYSSVKGFINNVSGAVSFGVDGTDAFSRGTNITLNANDITLDPRYFGGTAGFIQMVNLVYSGADSLDVLVIDTITTNIYRKRISVGVGNNLANFYLKDSSLSGDRVVDGDNHDFTISNTNHTYLSSNTSVNINSPLISIAGTTNVFEGDTWDWSDGGGNHYLQLSSTALTINEAYTLPFVDGTSGQVLTTNGTGTASWQTSSYVASTVTEQQNFYNNEFYWGHGLNTSTGAFTVNTALNISDYLPMLGSTSVTITTTDSTNITIYGWWYDSTLTAIQEIRSNTLIGTLLKTYTVTSPSNARYLVVYTKAASDSFETRLRIYSTNNITYNIPITPEQFTGTSDISRINQAANFARFTSSPLIMRGTYNLDSTIILSSGNTLICEGCVIKMKYGMHNNIIRNEAVAQPTSHIFNRGNRNIKIIGTGTATLQGSSEAWGGDNQTGLGALQWKLHMLILANVENFELTGFKIKSPNQWGIVIEQSRIGSIHNNTAEQGGEHTNQSFLQIHHGSHGINVYDNRQQSTDDFLAIENLQYHDSMNILSTVIYEPFRSNLDIFGVRVWGNQKSRITGYSGSGYGRSRVNLLTADGYKIHDCTIDGNDGYQEILLQDPGSTYAYFASPTVNDMYNITISNTTAPITINWPVKWCSFINVVPTDTTFSIASALPPSGSSKIYRKYTNGQQQWIDTVISSVETISYTSPIFKGSSVANGTVIIEGNSATSGNTATNASISLNVGNSGSTNAATIFNNGNISVGTTTSSFRVFAQSSAVSDGFVFNSQTTGWPLFALKVDGTTLAIIGANRNANDAVTGSAANAVVIRTGNSDLDLTTIPATGVQWRVKSTGDLITPIDATYAIGDATHRPSNIFISSNGTFGGIVQAPTIQGGTGSGGNLTFISTTNGTKGKLIFGTSAYDEVNNRLGIGNATPTRSVMILGSTMIYKGTAFVYADPAGTDFIVSNDAGDSRFLFGQSTSAYGGLKWNYNATAASAFMTIYSGDASKINFTLLQNGNVGIATVTSPTSVLHTTSFATGYVAKTANYTATISDYTIECTANTFQVTLPTAVGIAGRIYEIVNSGAGTITIGTTSSQTFVNVTATPTTLTMATVGTVVVKSNGVNWMRISNL